MHVENQTSAGGVLVRTGQVLLIRPAGVSRWQLPKGHVEEGESLSDAAMREVHEETGYRTRIVATLPSIDYWFSDGSYRRIHKRVHYFLLTGTGERQEDFDTVEIAETRWFDWNEGLARLSFDNDRAVVTQARQLVEEEDVLNGDETGPDAVIDLPAGRDEAASGEPHGKGRGGT